MRASILESNRLILVPLSLDHLSKEYVNWMNDYDVIEFLESGGDYTFKMLEKFLKEQVENKILFWAIHIKKTNKHIGNIKIDPIDDDKLSGEYGIMMGDKLSWGKGYATEASNIVIEYCFEQLNLNHITLGVVAEHASAVKLYKKIGFKIEKTLQIKARETYRMILEKQQKLILGTVQMGLDYGISNTKGKPSLNKSFEILNTAFNNHITILDTAEAYGNSQEVIGLFHKKYPNKTFKIISKIHPNFNEKKIDILKAIKTDCEILNVDSLYGYMFHHYASLKSNENSYHKFIEAKALGLVEKIGVSLYSNHEIEDVMKNYTKFDFIQLPFNLFDNEKQRKEILVKAKQKGIEIHTRSVFLQGLFFMDLQQLPSALLSLTDSLEKLNRIKEKYTIDTTTLALQYTLQKEYIDCIVIGVDSEKQLLSNLKVTRNKQKIPHQDIDTIDIKNTNLLNPSNW